MDDITIRGLTRLTVRFDTTKGITREVCAIIEVVRSSKERARLGDGCRLGGKGLGDINEGDGDGEHESHEMKENHGARSDVLEWTSLRIIKTVAAGGLG